MTIHQLDKEIASQQKWIETCGGDVAGYVAKYTTHGRTVENALAIYRADKAVLEQLLWIRSRKRK